jgi:lysophospholipase L1-like esterase
VISRNNKFPVSQKPALLLKIVAIILFFLWNFHITSAQDPLIFMDEVDSLSRLQIVGDINKRTILFTGSSSIRLWSDIQDYFHDKTIINTGFGGSHMSDLLFYIDDLVINYKPDQIFIYEGDNDIAHGVKPGRILRNTKKVVEKIQESLPASQVVLISAKPSPARWQFNELYKEVNSGYMEYAARQDHLDYVDVWSKMLDEAGKPDKKIFLEDSLHLNKAGYDIWAEEIGKVIQ